MIKQPLVLVLLVVVGSICLGACTLFLQQDRLIFYPRNYNGAAPLPTGWREHRFQTGQGTQIAYLAGFGNSGAPDAVPEILWWCFGGNAALARDWTDLHAPVTAAHPSHRMGFVLIDYPGYGLCEGKPGREAIAESIDAAAKTLATAYGLDETEIWNRSRALGHSLGAAVALETAARYGLDRVVAISPFTSLAEMANRTTGAPVGSLIRHRYDNRKSLETLAENPRANITLIHGVQDEIIPVSMGRELAKDHEDIVTYLEVPDAGHNDIFGFIGAGFPELLAP